jgi:long-chain acyl-CoA synthetase
MNLAQLRENVVLNEATRVSLYFKGQEFTNTELTQRSRRLVTVLKNLGVKRGDRVIVQMPNCPEVMQSFMAVWRLGAAIVPINYMMGEEEVAHIYADCGAKVVISSAEYLPRIRAGQLKAPDAKTVILVGGDVPSDCFSFQELTQNSDEESEIVETDEDDIAAIIYTAGTTGRSKGVIQTHRSLYYNAKMTAETVIVPEGSVSIIVLPLCHSYGIGMMNTGLFRKGARSVLLDSFDLDFIYSSIEKYKVNVMAAVPTMYVYMLMYPNPNKHDLSSMKYWFSGSAPLAVETWNRFKEVFGAEIIEGWGLTEAGANNATNPLYGKKKVGSIGKQMNGTDLRIMDDEGNLLPAGKPGELVLRGPQLMKGYWNRPEETAQAIRDGWLHTGDIGYADEDGYFWITDRKKDLIIKGGENISPRTIEEVLYTHPKISEAAVIGIKDEKYGENVKAFAVLRSGQSATSEEIVDYCRKRLSSFLVPKEVVFLEEFPKSLVGKILKKELRKL